MGNWDSWMPAIPLDEPCRHEAIVELESIESQIANVGSYDDWFPELTRPFTVVQQGGGQV